MIFAIVQYKKINSKRGFFIETGHCRFGLFLLTNGKLNALLGSYSPEFVKM